MTRRTRTIWFLVTAGTELLDLAGPWEVFSQANDVLGRRAYSLVVLGASGGEIVTRHAIVVGNVQPLPHSPRRMPNIVVVAGASPARLVPSSQSELSRWLERHQARIGAVVSICTGAFMLGDAGLLDGRRVTTHWRYLEELRTRYPRAHVVDEGIYLRDGRVWTSAGVIAGVDLALAIVEEHHGHAVAMSVAKNLVLFLRRSGNQAQFSSALRRQHAETGKLRELSAFIVEHLDAALSVERLAKSVALSPRSLTRHCRERFGMTPAELVRRHRLEEAQRLLESTELPMKSIAARAGFGDASAMWRAFTDLLGVTPGVYRSRFASLDG